MQLQTVESILSDAEALDISGSVHPDFLAVARAFSANFAKRGELGASLCVFLNGTRVIDLFGGRMAVGGPRWKRDTVSVVFSCTKVATALCLHLLAARGAVDLADPVSRHWPEFARNEKHDITLRMLLDHSAGMPAVRARLKDDCLQDWDYMVQALEAETPFWTPGTQVGYHAVTFGFLVGEVVRRVSGKSLGCFFREEIAQPLGLDFNIGLPEEEEPRVSPVYPYRPTKAEKDTPFLKAAMQKGTATNLFVFNSGDWALKGVNTRAGRAAEIGAANGVTNARGLAVLFQALVEGGGRLGLDPGAIKSFAQASSATHLDQTLRAPTRFGPGFMLSMGRRNTPTGEEGLVIGAQAFGHVGMGGSVGFADPERGLAFGYTMNRLGGGLLLNERGQSLIDATYRSIGATEDRHGFWT